MNRAQNVSKYVGLCKQAREQLQGVGYVITLFDSENSFHPLRRMRIQT